MDRNYENIPLDELARRLRAGSEFRSGHAPASEQRSHRFIDSRHEAHIDDERPVPHNRRGGLPVLLQPGGVGGVQIAGQLEGKPRWAIVHVVTRHSVEYPHEPPAHQATEGLDHETGAVQAITLVLVLSPSVELEVGRAFPGLRTYRVRWKK
jgi:hypothetical protein